MLGTYIFEIKEGRKMEIKDYLMDEIKRLNRLNDDLEKTVDNSDNCNLAIYQEIQKNALAMCEIAKANNPLGEKALQQINTYLGKKY